jgi:hypothetical protein
VRIKELQNEARRDFKYSKTLLASLAPFPWNEAVEKEAVENSMARVIFIVILLFLIISFLITKCSHSYIF